MAQRYREKNNMWKVIIIKRQNLLHYLINCIQGEKKLALIDKHGKWATNFWFGIF